MGSIHRKLLGLAFLSLLLWPLGVRASDDLTLTAQLIWGSNDQKPKDSKIKEVDSKLNDALHSVFKWKTYYEVGKTNIPIKLNETKRVRLSDKCEVEISNQGKCKVEVKLFGKGTLAVSKKQTLGKDPMVLAGPDKDDSAWFVIITNPAP